MAIFIFSYAGNPTNSVYQIDIYLYFKLCDPVMKQTWYIYIYIYIPRLNEVVFELINLQCINLFLPLPIYFQFVFM